MRHDACRGKVRDISVLVLLDLSESTNNKVNGHEYSILDLTRQATVLLAGAINRSGDPFAIHGFCSDGRHDVQYYRFKDFDQPYDQIPKMRIAPHDWPAIYPYGSGYTPRELFLKNAALCQEVTVRYY